MLNGEMKVVNGCDRRHSSILLGGRNGFVLVVYLKKCHGSLDS